MLCFLLCVVSSRRMNKERVKISKYDLVKKERIILHSKPHRKCENATQNSKYTYIPRQYWHKTWTSEWESLFAKELKKKNASNYAGVSYRHLTWLINKEIHDRRSMEERERNREEKIRNSLFCDDQHYYIDHWWGILYLFKFFLCVCLFYRAHS